MVVVSARASAPRIKMHTNTIRAARAPSARALHDSCTHARLYVSASAPPPHAAAVQPAARVRDKSQARPASSQAAPSRATTYAMLTHAPWSTRGTTALRHHMQMPHVRNRNPRQSVTRPQSRRGRSDVRRTRMECWVRGDAACISQAHAATTPRLSSASAYLAHPTALALSQHAPSTDSQPSPAVPTETWP